MYRIALNKNYFRNNIGLKYTLFFVIAPTIIGHTIPDNVPTPFEIPIKILAYLGAISKWLTLNPVTQKTWL